MTLYEILGVENTATKEEIKKAYRKKSNIHHPDKGGDNDMFITIKNAYNVLRNDEKREKYDKYGVTGDDADDLITQAKSIIETTVMSIIEANNNHSMITKIKLFERALSVIESGKSSIKQKIIEVKEDSVLLEIALERVSSTSEDFISPVIKTKIVELKNYIVGLKKELEVISIAIGMVKMFDYRVDVTEQEPDLPSISESMKNHFKSEFE